MSELETLINMLYQRDQEEMDAMKKKVKDYEDLKLENKKLKQKIAELESRNNNDLNPQPA